MTTEKTIKRQCKVITVQEKLAMLRTLEAGFSRRQVVDMFKCSQSTISRVLSEKEGIVKDAEENVHGKRENLLYYKELDRALSIWAVGMKNSNALISASLAKQKAEELSLTMGLELKPSTGWLYKWKERENITFSKRVKGPEEILKECYVKEQRLLQMRRNHLEKSKRVKAEKAVIADSKRVNQEEKGKERIKIQECIAGKNETIPCKTAIPQVKGSEENHVKEFNFENSGSKPPTIDTLKNKGDELNPVQETNAEINDNKPRTKREYIKRLPIFDASGAICRSRKEKTFLTLLQKLEILERLRNGEKRPDLIVEYNLSSSAMSQIVTDEEKILKLAAGGQNLHMKRIRGGIFKDGEAELNAWVQDKLEKGESLTRTHIKNKAKEIAERLNIEFKASTGWLEKWKVRMNLDFNENQKLQRKMPKLIPSDEEFDNSQAQFELSDSFYDEQDSEILQMRVKEERMENDDSDDIDASDGYLSNDMDMTDVKPELLTPQQFYLQTIRTHSQTLNSSYKQTEHQSANKEVLRPVEDPDVKPFIDTTFHSSQPDDDSVHSDIPENNFISNPKRTGSLLFKNNILTNGSIRTKSFAQERSFEENISNTGDETLHEEVLLWLNRYNIPPGAATELLNILQPHLNSVVKSSSNPVQHNLSF